MCGKLRKEFSLRNLWLAHNKEDVFFTSQWPIHPGGYIAYRIIVAWYTLASFLVVALTSKSGGTVMAYLTIWTYLMLTIYFNVTAVVAIYCNVCLRENSVVDSAGIVSPSKEKTAGISNPAFVAEKVPPEGAVKDVSATKQGSSDDDSSVGSAGSSEDASSWYMKVSWALGNIVYSFSIIVTLVYFSFLYHGGAVGVELYKDLNMHGLNSVLVVLDIFMVARPVRILHFIYPLLYGVLYIIFSVIYWVDDHNNVLYPNVLDWNNPGITAAFVVGLAVVGIPLLQLLLFALYNIRVFVHRRCFDSKFYTLSR